MCKITLALVLLCTPALAGDLPDHKLTPGVSRNLSHAEICGTKWGKDARKVTPAMKREVFARYGLSGNQDCPGPRHCEIDHLISRELGGADDANNLWPQPYAGKWGATRKDRLENRLHREVCSGRLSLSRAQRDIRTDWRIPYKRYFGEPDG